MRFIRFIMTEWSQCSEAHAEDMACYCNVCSHWCSSLLKGCVLNNSNLVSHLASSGSNFFSFFFFFAKAIRSENWNRASKIQMAGEVTALLIFLGSMKTVCLNNLEEVEVDWPWITAKQFKSPSVWFLCSTLVFPLLTPCSFTRIKKTPSLWQLNVI